MVPIKDSVVQSWHFSCSCFFLFFPSFFFAETATALPCICATLQPFSQVRKQLAFDSYCPVSVPLELVFHLAGCNCSVIKYNIYSCHHLGMGCIAWTAPERKSHESFPRCCCDCRLPLCVVWQISQGDPSQYSKYSLSITSEELDYLQSV